MLSINMDDVIKVINTCKPYIIALVTVLVLAIIITVAVKKMDSAKKRFIRIQSWIAAALAVVVIVNMICFGPMSVLISLSTGHGTITETTSMEAMDLCSEIADEGIVLLENDDSLLPFSEGAKLNVFGWSSTNPVYGGTGSGSVSDKYAKVGLLEGLEQAGFNVNREISDFYKEYKDARPAVGMLEQDWTLPEPAISQYPEGMLDAAEEFSDTALFVVSRPGGENADLPTDMDAVLDGSWKENDAFTGYTYFNGSYDDTLNTGNDWDKGQHYLQLSNREEELLDAVCSRFENVVVVVNTNNTMELDFVEDYKQIKSVVWCPGTGQSGFTALGGILNGTVNPSGKTVDIFAKDLTSTPYYNNIGLHTYDNMEEFKNVASTWFTDEKLTTLPTFVNYVEGIYVGYRFYETAAAEGLIDYDKEVMYPFGHGLTYTSFTQEISNVEEDAQSIRFKVNVTNTGTKAGKDIVQVYFNPPYTNGGIEKAAANLIAFDKTDILKPGETQAVEISFNIEDMASYDAYGQECYVLEKGEYVISVNKDSHTPIDSITYQAENDIVYDGDNARSTDGIAAVNQFEYAEGEVTYLSRRNHFENYKEATAPPASNSISEELKTQFVSNANYNPEEHNNPEDEMPVTGAKNGLKLAELRGAAYDDPKWDTLLDQMTVSDMDNLIALGGYQTGKLPSIGKVDTVDCDGPASINNNFTKQSSIGFPSGVMCAATWNEDLAYKFGASIGKMADEMDVSGWYAPAMNGHRSAFAGRNFEYYSEDGLLSGKIAAQALKGAESYGVYGYVKHFALNDQETGRCSMLCTFSNEQAIREIYLKPFEIAVKEGGAKAAMGAFNYIGTRWASALPELNQVVLRNEWGFQGVVITDYYGVYGYMDSDQAIRGGTDLCLASYDTETNHLTDKTSATSIKAMRQSCKNILYTVVNSRAYLPDNINMEMEGWKKAAIILDVIFVGLMAALELLTVKNYKKRRAEITIGE